MSKFTKKEITITLNKIKEHNLCQDGWEKLLTAQGKTEADDEEFPLAEVLKSNGLENALWCLRCLPEHEARWRLLAVKFARQVQHLMKDERSINALDVAERYANGEASESELKDARNAAEAAAWDAARAAAGEALVAAEAAARDAWDAWDAAWAAVRDAGAAGAARDAAGGAALAAAGEALVAARDAAEAAREKQEALFLEAVGTGMGANNE